MTLPSSDISIPPLGLVQINYPRVVYMYTEDYYVLHTLLQKCPNQTVISFYFSLIDTR